VLGDIPLSLFKYNLINSTPLLTLEAIFEKVCHRSFMDDIPMVEAALIEHPEMLLGLTDEYMGAMLGKLSETKSNIMVICGYGQTRSIPHYLYYSQEANSAHPISQTASYKPIYETIMRKDTAEISLDKLVILDLMLSYNASGSLPTQQIEHSSLRLINTKIAK
jgi:pheromone shutdown protein TraB